MHGLTKTAVPQNLSILISNPTAKSMVGMVGMDEWMRLTLALDGILHVVDGRLEGDEPLTGR